MIFKKIDANPKAKHRPAIYGRKIIKERNIAPTFTTLIDVRINSNQTRNLINLPPRIHFSAEIPFLSISVRNSNKTHAYFHHFKTCRLR